MSNGNGCAAGGLVLTTWAPPPPPGGGVALLVPPPPPPPPPPAPPAAVPAPPVTAAFFAPTMEPAAPPAVARPPASIPPSVDWRSQLNPVVTPTPVRHQNKRGGGAGKLLLLVLLVAGGVGGYWYWNNGRPAEPVATAAQEASVFAVGETGTISDLQVTVHQVVDPWTSTVPQEVAPFGTRFVAVEMTLTNLSDQAQRFSTVLGLEVRDSQGRSSSVAFAGSELPSLEGQLEAGTSRTGTAVFQVPLDATGLQLQVRGTVITPAVVWQIG